jgi:hypothetical protein
VADLSKRKVTVSELLKLMKKLTKKRLFEVDEGKQ